MLLLDTCGWIEWAIDPDLAESFAPPVRNVLPEKMLKPSKPRRYPLRLIEFSPKGGNAFHFSP